MNERMILLTSNWQDRRVKIGYETAEALSQCYNRNNWRFHPNAQRAATGESLDSLGWVGAIKKNITTENILDGHLRIEIALIKNPQTLLPVDYYELTKDEEELALAVLDSITGQAEIISDKFSALMERTKGMMIDKPALSDMMRKLKARPSINRMHSHLGTKYNTSKDHADHDIDTLKLAYRIEASWIANSDLALDLFSGKGQLAEWYKRRFNKVVMVDKQSDYDTDYCMDASDFIQSHINEFIGFDFVDFDDEGTPALEIQELFNAIEGKKNNPFILCLTDGLGVSLQIKGKVDLGKLYLQETSVVRQLTTDDYDNFEDMVTQFVEICASRKGFKSSQISSYWGHQGSCIYQAWRIEPLNYK